MLGTNQNPIKTYKKKGEKAKIGLATRKWLGGSTRLGLRLEAAHRQLKGKDDSTTRARLAHAHTTRVAGGTTHIRTHDSAAEGRLADDSLTEKRKRKRR